MTVVVVLACTAAAALATLRWLRIAQREHYLSGSVTRFALRWWLATPLGTVLAVAAGVATVATIWWIPAALVVAAVEGFGPPGLRLKGSSSSLAWTDRARRLAIAMGVVIGGGIVIGLLVHPVVTAAVCLLLPAGVDLGLAVMKPVEVKLGASWVNRAAATLRSSGATVVAITGSYGKTSTKGYVAHLLGGVRTVLASPASFNNRMGLARAINENLTGTVDVFVAEMGTYGPGEIADLCTWITPQVGVITAIGPVHLERFGNEERIVEAKAEILARAETAVINTDDTRLAALADREAARLRVIRAGSGEAADVQVQPDGTVLVSGQTIGRAPATVHPTNLACAVGVVAALGIEPAEVADRLATVPEPAHRRTLATGTSGVRIIDDTFNSNPAGASAALAMLQELDVTGRRVVVTPGMVELGSRQKGENRHFGEAAARIADVVIIVGRTNRRALVEGAAHGPGGVMTMSTREEAVGWVKANLGPEDAVLYENDLPDHYP